MVKGDFTFYNVGQGLFYGGQIATENKKWTVVYDCGTISKGCDTKECIDDFLCKTHCRVIDLLMLSHFHEDHINGLFTLLKSLKTDVNIKRRVRRLILPYFTPGDLALMAVRLVTQRKMLDEGNILEFLSSPTRYLLENYDIDEILLVSAAGTVGPNNDSSPEMPQETQDEDIMVILEPDEEAEHDFKHVFFPHTQGGKSVTVKKVKGAIICVSKQKSISKCWTFVFFNDAQTKESDVRGKILAQLREELKIDSWKDWDLQTLRKIFDEGNWQSWKTFYSKHVKTDPNDSTLVVFHAPTIATTMEVDILKTNRFFDKMERYITRLCPFYGKRRAIRTMNNGTLLLGDIRLTKKVVEALTTRALVGEHKASVCLVPHHGSYPNWSDEMPKYVAPICAWIVSSGIHGGYGHPDKKLIDTFVNLPDHYLLWCNEYTSIHIEMHS